jgi:hypothetical protein
MELLRGLQTNKDPARNASDPTTSQQPRQASLDQEPMETGDGDVSGKSLE